MSMLAAQYSAFGSDLTQITVKTVEKPSLVGKTGFALVKIYAASINPADAVVKDLPLPLRVIGGLSFLQWMNRNFFRPVLNFNFPNFAVPLPFIPGTDFSGTIETVTEDVKGLKAGDDVFSMHWGTAGSMIDEYGGSGGAMAQYIAIPVSYLSRKPRNVTHEQAAALAMVGTTGEVPMRMANVKAGDRVLVIGGSSAVGTMAIQCAKLKGAYVITTCSTRAKHFVSQLGADEIINYEEKKWYEELKDLDLVYDAVGEKDAFTRVKKINGLVKHGGSFLSMCDFAAGYNLEGHRPRFHLAGFHGMGVNEVPVLDYLAQQVADKKLIIPIEDTYPFTTQGVQDGFKKVAGRKSLGKNVIQITH